MSESIRRISLEGAPMTLAQFMETNSHDEIPREFYDGVVKVMSPSPSRRHQQIVLEVYSVFRRYFMGKRCTPWIQRDVVLQSKEKGDQHDTVVVPDLFVLCDGTKDDGQNVHGAPDLVLEVWSPGNSGSERASKHKRYEEAGVKEIWEVFPETGHVIVYYRECDGYSTYISELDGLASSREFDGLVVDFSVLDLD